MLACVRTIRWRKGMGQFRKVFMAGVVLSSLLPGAAGAQEETEDRTRAEAQEVFERAVLLMQNENWEIARAEFQRSVDLFPTRSALFDLAMCEKALHHYRISLQRFQEWQERYSASAPEEEQVLVEQEVDELVQFLGTLVIATEPAGAEIRVDGEVVGTTPLPSPVTVDAARHVVEATLAGYLPARQEVVMTPLASIDVVLAMAAEPVAESQTRTTAEAGPDEGGSVVAHAEIPTGAVGEDPGIDQAWFWSLAGTAAAMGIGGAIAGGVAVSWETDLQSLGTRCQGGDLAACDDGREKLGQHDDAQLAANVLLFGGAALAVTVAVLAFFTDFDFGGEAPPALLTASPAVDASGTPVGASLGVVFAF
jgi:hypothetical protein